MEDFIIIAYNGLIDFYHSGFFSLIKFLVGIYTIILLVDIILLLIKVGIGGSLRETLIGMDIPQEFTTKKRRARKDWQDIRHKLESANETDYKVAIIQADAFIDDLVSRMGYAGDNFGERLANIPADHIVNIEGMQQAHEIRNRIIHDENFVVSREDAEIALGQFEELLKSYQVID
jgi:hypothetical protein